MSDAKTATPAEAPTPDSAQVQEDVAVAQAAQSPSVAASLPRQDVLRVPEDAGEHLAGIRQILGRIPDNWGRQLRCQKGWYGILVELDEKLAQLDPDYVVYQAKEKFGCYDESTEVLTSSGWKLFRDLTHGESLATLSPQGELEYQIATDLTRANYSGAMYHLKTRGVDLLVTPNHRLYVAKGTRWDGRQKPPRKIEYPFHFETPDESFGKNKRFLKAAVWTAPDREAFILPELVYHNKCGPAPDATERCYRRQEREFKMDAWLTFLGWYIAEGCTSPNGGDTRIACNNTDGGDELRTLGGVFEDISLKYVVDGMERSACILRFHDVHVGKWLRQHCGHGALNKTVPRFVGDCSARQIELFLEALYAGDGHKGKTWHTLFTISRQLAGDVQELIMKTGRASSQTLIPMRPETRNIGGEGHTITQRHDSYGVNWMGSDDHNTADKGLAPSSSEEWIDYEGEVFCATVPNGTLFVRRNGIPVWCGNSLRYYVEVGNQPSFPEAPYPSEGSEDEKAQWDIDHKACVEQRRAWLEETPEGQALLQLRREANAIIAEAEERSMRTCELCGAGGRMCTSEGRWKIYQTLCTSCAKDKHFVAA